MTDSKEQPTRRTWRDRLRALWPEPLQRHRDGLRWLVLGTLWLIALALGYVGFARHAVALGEARSPLDIVYLTLQLVSLNSGAVPGPVPWELEMARLLIPALAAYTVFQALAVLFREQIQLARLWFVRDHVVICGLSRKGFLLAKSFREQGDSVVVIEQDEENDWLESCRERGVLVLLGDATDPARLRQAAVHRARCLIAVCGDDGANAEIAMCALALAQDRTRGALTCIIHIVDPQLCDLLREREIGISRPDFRLELFNVFDRGARLLWQEHPPMATNNSQSPPRLLVIGLGSLGESLVVRAARDWWDRRPEGGHPMRITVIDRAADARCASLAVRYPRLADACDLVPQQIDIRSPEFLRAEFLRDSQGQCAVDAAYVCLDDDSLGLHAGLVLLQQLRPYQVPIVVRMAEEAGLATLLRGGRDGASGPLRAFGLLDRTCTPDLLLGGTHEVLARALHEDYVRQQAQAGQTPPTNPILVPWSDLPAPIQEANRRQVDRLCARLRTVGYSIAPLVDWDAGSFRFPAAEVEQMAGLEHDEWCAEQRRAGWTYAPGPKDSRQKTHPDLLAWTELSEPEREKNRSVVRELPGLLARAGFQVVTERSRSAALDPA
ncbi:MAG: NAD-binding protein [Chloroflexi bacterium]|nr:NAD-binding protein [Chloroflexota bacterium]